jgi:hypothetical protein
MPRNCCSLVEFMTHKVRGEDRYHIPLFVEKVNGRYILAAYQGSISEFDILIKYRQLENSRWSAIRTPKHIHWAVDILIKLNEEPEKTKAFLDILLAKWEETNPIRNSVERIAALNIDSLLANFDAEFEQYQLLNDKGEYSLKFLIVLAKLLMLQEKTNREDAYMFKKLLSTLKNSNNTIYQTISTATHRGN